MFTQVFPFVCGVSPFAPAPPKSHSYCPTTDCTFSCCYYEAPSNSYDNKALVHFADQAASLLLRLNSSRQNGRLAAAVAAAAALHCWEWKLFNWCAQSFCRKFNYMFSVQTHETCFPFINCVNKCGNKGQFRKIVWVGMNEPKKWEKKNGRVASSDLFVCNFLLLVSIHNKYSELFRHTLKL